jgi:hypothetical protein
VVRLDGVRDIGGHRNHPSCENATDRSAGDILQSAVAYSCGVSSMGKGDLVGFASGIHRLAFLWVPLPIVAVPWGYVFVTYLYKPKK